METSPERVFAPHNTDYTTPPRLVLPSLPVTPGSAPNHHGSPADTVRISPSCSLTSPFPLQFRTRLIPTTPPQPLLPPSTSTAVSTEQEDSRRTIDLPLSPMMIGNSSSLSQPSLPKRSISKVDRPPTFPGRSTAGATAAASKAVQNDLRRQRVAWRLKFRSNIRSTPMLDVVSDEEDDEDQDDDGRHVSYHQTGELGSEMGMKRLR